MLSYVAEQAVSGDQVMYCMAIHNSVLLQWYNSKSEQKYVDFLNEIIPNGSIKVKTHVPKNRRPAKVQMFSSKQTDKET